MARLENGRRLSRRSKKKRDAERGEVLQEEKLREQVKRWLEQEKLPGAGLMREPEFEGTDHPEFPKTKTALLWKRLRKKRPLGMGNVI